MTTYCCEAMTRQLTTSCEQYPDRSERPDALVNSVRGGYGLIIHKRGGKVVARVIADVRAATLETFVHESVSTKVSFLCTDKWVGYKHLDRDFPHETVDHAAGQYVVGAVHTQTIEGFWSLIKRGMIGTYHKVSKKYLLLYVAELQFRYNNRLNEDIFGEAIRGC